jgi:hypothetical protein
VLWIALALFSLTVAATDPTPSSARVSLRERFGLDALSLLARRDYRAILLTAGLLSIPLAAFYPFAPAQLRDLGFERTSAWMSLAQITEVMAMFALGRCSPAGHASGCWPAISASPCFVTASVTDEPMGAGGVSLHGFAFTLFFIAAPIYLNDRTEPA